MDDSGNKPLEDQIKAWEERMRIKQEEQDRLEAEEQEKLERLHREYTRRRSAPRSPYYDDRSDT